MEGGQGHLTSGGWVFTVVIWNPGHNVTRPPSVFAGRAPQREANLLMAGCRVHPLVSAVLQFHPQSLQKICLPSSHHCLPRTRDNVPDVGGVQ